MGDGVKGTGSGQVVAYPILLTGVALGFDAVYRRVQFGLLCAGLLDEVAHLATAALGMLVLACLVDAPRRFYVAALIASVAIGLDHIPLYLGLLGDQAQRLVTHSLATVVSVPLPRSPVADIGPCWREQRPDSCFISPGTSPRDPPDVRMLWPVQQASWIASYWWFLRMIIAFTAARFVLVSTGIPGTRARLFQAPPRTPHSLGQTLAGPVAAADGLPGPRPDEPDIEDASVKDR